MALDRPASQPDHPDSLPRSDAPAAPYGAAALTRAEAFATHRYWNEVARLSRLWDGHKERWPAKSGKPDQPAGAEPSAEVTDSIAQIKAAESAVSADIKEIASGDSARGWLEGFKFRLKGEGRLREKIANAVESSSPDATVAEIAEQIPDAIRYTFCFSATDYTTGYFDVTGRLEERGHHMYKSRNSWTDAEYKGVNTRWVTPEGQRFEVQFHTPESFHAKHEVTHEAYERIRDPTTTAHERRDLSSFQREVSSWIPVPPRATEIADFSERGY